MGTSNFHNVNAKCIYPVLIDYESFVIDDDGNETEEKETVQSDENDQEFLIDFLYEKFNELNLNFQEGSGSDLNELRSYPSKIVGSITKEKTIGGLSVSVCLTSVIRFAYYEGANLDYEIFEEIEGEDLVNIEDQYDFYSEYKGISKKHAQIALNWLETTKNELVDLFENVYREVSGVKLRKVATFSNGETIYENC
jgi:hypothetical protein